MPEETHVIRGINWRETFPFTNIFRAFRVAIHPSKLILALLAILLIYVAGRALDGMTSARSRGIPNEIEYYESFRTQRLVTGDQGVVAPELNERVRKAIGERNADYPAFHKSVRDRLEGAYAQALVAMQVTGPKDKPITLDEAKEAAESAKYADELKDKLKDERDKQVKRARDRREVEVEAAKDGYLQAAKDANDRYYAAVDTAEAQKKNALEAADKLTDSAARDAARNKANDEEAKARTAANDARKKSTDEAKATAKTKYDALKGEDKDKEDKRRKEDRVRTEEEYDKQIRAAYLETSETWEKVRHIKGEGLFDLFMDYEITRVNDVVSGVFANNWFGGLTDANAPGVFASALRFFSVAPRWAFRMHPMYFSLMAIIFMIVWALFGGAIARIAAVHVAREEKLSMRQALRFSSGKFLSFVFAPVIPVAIVGIVGLIVSIGGLLLYVPYIGEILVAIFFFLALAAGFVMTLVALGTFGGLNLMYPTIAVEGSDSFDAISRSFSYVYARPWRMLWYTAVSIAYGAVTFLFVRLFIWMTLAFTHKAVGFLVARSTDAERSMWNTIWPGSGFWHLPYTVDYLSLTWSEKVAAFFVAFWVFLVIAFLGAYLISYYFSSSTIIYYLMRREVDATELDDVYVEQSDDDFVDPSGAAPTTVPVPGTPAVVTTETTTVVVTPPPSEGTPPPAGG